MEKLLHLSLAAIIGTTSTGIQPTAKPPVSKNKPQNPNINSPTQASSPTPNVEQKVLEILSRPEILEKFKGQKGDKGDTGFSGGSYIQNSVPIPTTVLGDQQDYEGVAISVTKVHSENIESQEIKVANKLTVSGESEFVGKTFTKELTSENTQTNILTIGSKEKPTGIVLYDKTTKNPVCLSVKNLQIQITSGDCTEQEPEQFITLNTNSLENSNLENIQNLEEPSIQETNNIDQTILSTSTNSNIIEIGNTEITKE